MIGQSKAKQSDVEQINLLLDKILSNAIELSEVDEEISLLAHLPQEDTAPQKQKKSGQLFRWSIFSLLGFGLIQANQTSSSKTSSKKELTTVTILCESPKTGVKQKLANPFLQNGTTTFAEGTVAPN
jgi:hypothetical protein